ncbi:MAG: polysaccharide pyruvyl transferase family protein [Carnobacterium sp.]|uniref:polysaccharide pyruvyl transferase family protein n=1 Tax=Carnobacterium sp. TaxID=48221 RepID=UPI0033153CED
MNLFLDVYLEKNLGDDLFVSSVLMRYPEHTFIIFTQLDYSEFEDKYANLKVIKINKYVKFVIEKLRGTNLLKKWLIKKYKINAFVCIGGSIFIQYEGWEKLFQERMDLWGYMKKRDIKIFIIGSNFGPYSSDHFLSRYDKAFDYVEDICFRDSYSYDLFKHRTNVRQEADVILSYPTEAFKTVKEDSVGISIINLIGRKNISQYQDAYVYKMVSTINHFTLQGKKVYLLSFCEREGDETNIEFIMEQISERKQLVDKIYYKGDIDKFLVSFSKIKQIIACRFHSIILGYLFNKEIYSLNYSKKSSNFIEDYQLNIPMKSIENIEKLNPEIIDKSFEKAKKNTELTVSGSKQYFELDKFFLK